MTTDKMIPAQNKAGGCSTGADTCLCHEKSAAAESASAENEQKAPLLSVQHLSKVFSSGPSGLLKRFAKKVHAINDISFDISSGETLGLVGESGCGKSTTGRCIVHLTRPTSGKVIFEGNDIAAMKRAELKQIRRSIQYIFQDPYASLNPRMTVGETIAEPLVIHKLVNSAKKRKEAVQKLLDMVGLNPEHANRYPHEFSGGQRQRVGIARAFALRPKLVICDEPVSALDVSIQAQILNLLKDLQKRYGTAYLFIAHDLSVVQHISDRIAVMYLGHFMELSDWKTLYDTPYHPYTQSLLSAAPVPDPDLQQQRRRIILPGDSPSPLHLPSGCPFHVRCPIAKEVCFSECPELREVAPGHFCACHFAKAFPIERESVNL